MSVVSQDKVVKKKAKKVISKLSFADDEEEDSVEQEISKKRPNGKGKAIEDEDNNEEKDETPMFKKSKFGKDPNIDTSFLPDREREEEERKVREELRQEWLRKQDEIKKETIQITYSYWDGSGHRKEVEVTHPFGSKPQLSNGSVDHTYSIYFQFATNFVSCSAGRETLSLNSWKSAASSSSSCGASVSTT